MEEYIIAKDGPKKTPMMAQDFIQPPFPEPKTTCHECPHNDQDVDTYPCATCHTRN